MNTADQPTIRLIEESDPLREQALRLVLALPGDGVLDVQTRVDRLLHYLDHQSLQLGVVLGAMVSDRLVSAVMLIESPGRLGATFIPAGSAQDSRRNATGLLLNRLPQHAWDRSLILIQALVECEARADAKLFAEAGFQHLAELIYLERPARAPVPSFRPTEGLDFVAYNRARHSLFLDVLEQTYLDSLDCPRLSGIRRPEEVLATHRATGIYDPQGWFVVLRQGDPVGILLLAGAHDRPAFEIVYMGIIPQARAIGIGHAILNRAVDYCCRHRHADLTLAVDQHNEPARRLYERWGMRETIRRSAWFTPNPQRTG